MLVTSYITKFPTFDLLMGAQVTFKLDFGKKNLIFRRNMGQRGNFWEKYAKCQKPFFT